MFVWRPSINLFSTLYSLQKKTQDISLIWPREGAHEKKREHKTNTIKPWRLMTTKYIDTQHIQPEDEITLITDIRYDNIEALVCYLLIAGNFVLELL